MIYTFQCKFFTGEQPTPQELREARKGITESITVKEDSVSFQGGLLSKTPEEIGRQYVDWRKSGDEVWFAIYENAISILLSINIHVIGTGLIVTDPDPVPTPLLGGIILERVCSDAKKFASCLRKSDL